MNRKPHMLFITGKLAEPSLRRMLAELAPQAGFDFSVAVLPITVVALATTDWIARHLPASARDAPGSRPFDKVLLPGLCLGDTAPLRPIFPDVPVEHGPADLRDLPEYFGSTSRSRDGYGAYDITILAEINHAPRLPLPELLRQAKQAQAEGADVIDLGCDPGGGWSQVGEAVAMLRGEGLRVSLDSFDPQEAAAAAQAGAELILSVNHTNRAAAKDWGCEVVAVPDIPAGLQGLDATLETLEKDGVPHRIDPVLEPIGFGFAASLGRYIQARQKYPRFAMMMGVGNLTELTDVDSAGINVLLLGFCQELSIHSVLTTEVINWCRSCIRELDLARRLVWFACQRQVLPKHLESGLHLLRDPKLRSFGDDYFRELTQRITDRNFRLFAENGALHVINGQMRLHGSDPFALFAEMHKRQEIDPSHAFYLGYELAKAVTALTLGKNYVQDQALQWGFLTRPENDSHDASRAQ